LNEHRFTLRFDVSAVSLSLDGLLERLAAGGCDDAIAGVGTPGRLALSFDRAADSATRAVTGAVRDVRAALPGATLLGASPDVVGLTDIARLVGRSRQNMRKLLLGSRGAPAPIHEGSAAVWHLAPVLVWLRDEKAYAVFEDLVELAQTTMQLNLAVEAQFIDRALQRELRTLVG
jgi:hypothetical protein